MEIQPDDILKMSIEDIKTGDTSVLAIRHMNCLIHDFDAYIVGDLVRITKKELLEHRALRRISFDDLEVWLADKGLSLGMSEIDILNYKKCSTWHNERIERLK